MPNELNDELFDMLRKGRKGITYADVNILPNESDVAPVTTSTRTRIAEGLYLEVPIISSPMDTVTEWQMAVGMAKAGGMGFIHRNLEPADQAKQIGRVLWQHRGLIETPITVSPDTTIAEFREWRTNGDGSKFTFDTFPVVDEEKRVLGLITKRNLRYHSEPADEQLTLGAVMTPRSQLVTANPAVSRDEAFAMMKRHQVNMLILLDGEGVLAGMYLFSNLEQICSATPRTYSLDDRGLLITGAAIGTGEKALERTALLYKRGVRMIQVDTSHGDSRGVISTIPPVKREFPGVIVFAGNVVTADAAKRLADAGADFVVVGVGPGSICTTRITTGVGRAQLTSVYEVARALRGTGVGVVADGGIKHYGDFAKAIVAGADIVMVGSLVAGTDECPVEDDWSTGERMRRYRGMGSEGALTRAGSLTRYNMSGSATIAQGVEGLVLPKGPVAGIVQQVRGSLQAAMGLVGARNLSELRDRAVFEQMSGAALAESHPHSLQVMKAARNYSGA